MAVISDGRAGLAKGLKIQYCGAPEIVSMGPEDTVWRTPETNRVPPPPSPSMIQVNETSMGPLNIC